LLATAEAFANAVEHPQEPTAQLADVEGTITDQAVTISIRDWGTWQSDPTRKQDGGFGQVLMEKTDGSRSGRVLRERDDRHHAPSPPYAPRRASQ
jgi:anti-sigma regulatory factor (Ser/Thr protein kinase)